MSRIGESTRIIRFIGPQGIQGIQGLTGPQGPQGEDGADGGGEQPLTFSSGLTRTGDIITNNLITGINGSQTIIGSTIDDINATLNIKPNDYSNLTSAGSINLYGSQIKIGGTGADGSVIIANKFTAGTSSATFNMLGDSSTFIVNAVGDGGSATFNIDNGNAELTLSGDASLTLGSTTILETDLMALNIKYIILRLLDAATDQTVADIVGGDFVWPFDGTLDAIFTHSDTAGTTGLATIDVNKNGTTILSEKITIDDGEKDSSTAATPPVISTATFVKGDIYTFDQDVIQTTAAKGLSIRMKVTVTSYT